MYIYRPCIAGVLISPYDIQQILAAVHFVRIHGEQLEQVEFLGSQIHLPFSDDHPPALTVNLHTSLHQHLVIHLA